MKLIGTADQAQLAILTRILDDHCRAFGIADDQAREDLGRRIMALFNCGGYSMEQIEQSLCQPPGEEASSDWATQAAKLGSKGSGEAV